MHAPDRAPDDCAATALAAGTPFWRVTAEAGIDSIVSTAWVYDGDRFWVLSQDDWEGEQAKVLGWQCVGPRLDDDDPRAPICDAMEPEGTRYLVCGKVCDGCMGTMPLPFDHDAVVCTTKANGAVVCRPA